jgi:uncharacterized protein (TIGR01244 family)
MLPIPTKVTLWMIGAAVPAAIALSQNTPPADPDLPRIYQVTADITTAAQPSSEGLAKLQLRGYQAVMNLRLEEEGALEERLVVEKLGMVFLHVPIRDIDPQTVERFAKALREAPRPLLIHGDSGNRVGALWMIYRVFNGANLSEARSEAEAIGLSDPDLMHKALAYIQQHGRATASQTAPSPPP